MSQRRGLWAQLDWWGKLEVLGIIAIVAFCALAAVDPVLADSLFNSVADPLRSFFEGLR